MRVFWLLQVLLVVLAPALIYGGMHRKDPSRALRGGGLVLVGTYTLLFGTFFVGSVVTDPGGWTALAAATGWLTPLVAVSLLAWQRPRIAGAMLIALPLLPTLALVAATVQGSGPQGWPIAVLTAPAAIAGGAYLASTLVDDHPGLVKGGRR